MNGNAILRLGVMVVGLFLSMVVIFQVLTDYRNNLSSLFKMLAIGGFAVGFLQPRLGAYLLILTCAYLDVLKRCLLLFGQVYFNDVVTVLSVSPLLFAGVCTGLLFGRVKSGRFFSTMEFKLFAVTVAIGLVVIAANVRAYGSLGSGIINGANGGAYIPMLLFVGFLFPRARDQRTYLRFMLIAFIPVALYTFKQAYFGLSPLEQMYCRSGLTVNMGEDLVIRPFSTLNSAHALGIVMVTLFTLALYKTVSSRRGRYFYALLSLLFLGAVIPGYMRTAWAMALAMPICFVVFRSRRLTLFLYGTAIVFFATVVAASSWLRDNINELSVGSTSGSNWIARAGTAGTMSERLEGFRNWSTNSEMWSLFGLDEEKIAGDSYFGTHDMIGGLLVSYGAVGLFCALGMGVFGLYFAHSRVLRIPDRDDRFLCICYLSILFGLIFTGALSGNHLHIFPINFLFWFITGALVAVVVRSAQKEKTRAALDRRGGEGDPAFVAPASVPSHLAPGGSFAGAGQPAPRFARSGRVLGGQPQGIPFRGSGKVALPGLGDQGVGGGGLSPLVSSPSPSEPPLSAYPFHPSNRPSGR